MSSATWSILLPVALAGITGTVILSYVAASLLAGIVPWAWAVVSAARRSPTPAAPRR